MQISRIEMVLHTGLFLVFPFHEQHTKEHPCSDIFKYQYFPPQISRRGSTTLVYPVLKAFDKYCPTAYQKISNNLDTPNLTNTEY